MFKIKDIYEKLNIFNMFISKLINIMIIFYSTIRDMLDNNIISGSISSGVNAGVGAMTISASNTIGNAMSSTVLNGGSLWDALYSGIKSAGDKETLKSMVVSGGVAGMSTTILELTNGTTSLEKGGNAVYKPDDSILEEYEEKFGTKYNGVVDRTANNIGMANTIDNINLVGKPIMPYSENPFDKSFWQGFVKEGGFVSKTSNSIPGMNSMSLMHDYWSSTAITKISPILQLTIAPAMVVHYCATFSGLCGNITTNIINKNNSKIKYNENKNYYNATTIYNINNNLNINYNSVLKR